MESNDPHFLDHPEVRAVFADAMSVLMRESDRGAVLVATSIVDQHLRRLFEEVFPADMRGKDGKRLLDYPGPLSTMSARVDVARAVGLIGQNVHQAIRLLKKIRNDVAHSPDSFRLADHHETLWKIHELLGAGLPRFISQMAGEVLIGQLIEEVKDTSIEIPGEEPKRAFDSPRAVLEHLQRLPDAMGVLQEKSTRLELGLGIGFICAIIVVHRNHATRSRDR